MSLMGYHPNKWLKDFEEEFFPQMSSLLKKDAQTVLREWAPKVDIKEQKDKYLVYVDVPGTDAKDISVEMEDNTLTIKGEKVEDHKEETSEFYHKERMSGKFFRQLLLPDSVSTDNILAKMKNGVLVLTIPKQQQKQIRAIKIDADEA